MDESFPFDEPHFDASDILVKELAGTLRTSVRIADDHEMADTSDGEEEEEELNDYEGCAITSTQKHLNRYVSFPSPRKTMSPSSSDKEDEESEPALPELFSEEH
ncbi:hypothetical protein CRG98_018636, partial [Punica granatum]